MSTHIPYKYTYIIFIDCIIFPVALSYGTTYLSFNKPRIIAIIELLCTSRKLHEYKDIT